MNTTRLNIHKTSPQLVKGLIDVEAAIDASPLDAGLKHLIKLRASQMNGCAYCVEMHGREARQDGEKSERLDALVVWRDTNRFSAAERAALAWTEALTDRASHADLDRLFQDLETYFTAEEIAAIAMSVAAINAWNCLGIAAHGTRVA